MRALSRSRSLRHRGVCAHGADRVRGDGARIVHGSPDGARSIEHDGSAHDEAELEALKAAARQRLAGQVSRWRSCPRGWDTCGTG